MFMIDTIMIKEINKISTDQTVEIEEFHLVVEYSMDKIIETDQSTNRITGITLREKFPLLKETLVVM